MNEAVLAGEDLHEGSEVFRADDFAGVGGSDLNFCKEVADHLHRAVHAFAFDGVNMHGAVFLDVDLGAGLGLDALDDLATRSDEFADAILIDLDGFDPWGVRADFTRASDDAVHDFEDGGAADLGFTDAFLEDGERDAGEFQIQLVAGDAEFGAAEFEIHVTEMIFAAEDVEHREVAFHRVAVVELRDETDADARDGTLQRHASVEQGHDAGTNRSHGSGAVGFHHFAADAHGVGEIFDTGDDWIE